MPRLNPGSLQGDARWKGNRMDDCRRMARMSLIFGKLVLQVAVEGEII